MSVKAKPISLLVGIPNLAERLEKLSTPEPMSGCRIWIGAISGGGKSKRPTLVIKRERRIYDRWNAARVSFFVTFGSFDEKLNVCHKCDNEFCIEPRHLFLGTHLDNNRDRHQKGRTRVPGERGVQRYNSKLIESDIEEIFCMRNSGLDSTTIAERFGVARQTIANVLYRRAWRHATQNISKPVAIARRNQKVFGEEIFRVIELRRQGWTYDKLSKEFKVSVSGIQGILNRSI